VFERLTQKVFAPRAWLRFRPGTWREMIEELHRRGEDRRESGAFLLGGREGDSRLVTRVVYLDDIDPECLVGGIHLHGEAYGKLWDICSDANLQVMGDIHTHPADWVGQSSTDRENPMVARQGHIGLIAPNFASGDIEAKHLGVHRYRGEEGWNSHFGREARRLIYIGRFA
jgi:proteasome lid subunit RPN8/RPN11